MPNAADDARARRIAEQIRSARESQGAYSVFSRIKTEDFIGKLAIKIASTYPNGNLNNEELRRVVLTQERLAPDQFWNSREISENLRGARQEEAEQIPIRDINRQTLAKMTPVERLNFINSAEVPRRFKLLEPEENA